MCELVAGNGHCTQLVRWEFRLGAAWEWYYAVNGNNRGSEHFPWGAEYQQGCANISNGDEYLGCTSAMIYPQGAHGNGVADDVGNVWEWCLGEYKNIKKQNRYRNIGFRVFCVDLFPLMNESQVMT